LLLLAYQNPPLRQGLLSALIHAPSLPQSALADKMWFRYRSLYSCTVSRAFYLMESCALLMSGFQRPRGGKCGFSTH
jgi:hypothetical protein